MIDSVKRASGVSIICGDQILLGKRCLEWEGKPATLGGYWSIFGGSIEEGENSMICAIRELKEETGIEVPFHLLSYVKDIYNETICGSITRFSVYFAGLLYQPEIVLNDEHTDYIWFDIKKIDDFPYKIKPDLVDCIKMYFDKRYIE